ncbi:HEPN domain-containing protein [Flavobacterium sp.]|uniref:HEPN domain-containing protein n=1 Tax=Flavobacterium sp. TaxID=239 RepID=UPI003B9BF425
MTKQEHIQWWIDEADRNWETAIFNMNGKQNVFALFAFHLCVEKLLKAAWVKDNVDNIPPRTHDLTKLYNDTDLQLEPSQYDFLIVINDWNIDGRYPDYKLKVYARATDSYLQEQLTKIAVLIENIKRQL